MNVIEAWLADLREVLRGEPAAVSDVRVGGFYTAGALGVLGAASVVVIAGSALGEGGLDALLAAAASARSVVLAGPTASAWPRPFFERGVHVMGGIRVLDGRALLQVVSEGGSGCFFAGMRGKGCV